MPGLRTSWIALDLGYSGTTTGYREAAVPVNGTIMEAWAGSNVLPTAGTLAVAKGSTNILASTNINLASSGGNLTAGVASSLALATANSARRVSAGDVLKATWTITTAGSFVGGSCIVFVEPDAI